MKRILLADDSLTIQKVVELTFMDEDYEVEAMGSGDAVLARLDEGRPDVLIADIHMPGLSGYEICRRAKSEYPGLPVLLLVGTFETLDEDELRRSGADGHLKKPFDSQELLQTVNDLVAARGAPTEVTRVEGFEATAHAPESPPSATPIPEVVGAVAASPAAAESAGAAPSQLTDDHVERIARRVAELMGDRVLREVAWEVLPDLAEVVVRERLRELEAQVE
ncbi:MAG: response regulator [Thermoanaerobaculia bacterium]